jgi:hypothetical protein
MSCCRLRRNGFVHFDGNCVIHIWHRTRTGCEREGNCADAWIPASHYPVNIYLWVYSTCYWDTAFLDILFLSRRSWRFGPRLLQIWLDVPSMLQINESWLKVCKRTDFVISTCKYLELLYHFMYEFSFCRNFVILIIVNAVFYDLDFCLYRCSGYALLHMI